MTTKTTLQISVDAFKAIVAERDRLRAALEQVFQHAFDADTPNEAIREDFDAMREIARAALNQNKVSS